MDRIKLIKLFFEEPSREFNVREVARILKISPTNASKKLNKLKTEGILKSRKLKKFIFYKADIKNEKYQDMKIYYNIRKIKESGLLDALNKFYLKPSIVIFGSFSNGMDTETSDIDLVVVSEKTTHMPNVKEFEKKLNRPIQIFAVKNIKQLKNPHLINNVLNGIVLQGGIKWI